jgi:hypothetical protein
MRNYRSVSSLGLITIALAALSLDACGQSDAQLDRKRHDSCVSSLTAHGLSAAYAEAYCTCTVKESDKLPEADKVQLLLHPDKMRAVARTCITQVGEPPTNAP